MLNITGKTKLLGIIGDPVEHSLSPVIQNKAIAELGLDYVYVPLPVKPKNLPQALEGFMAMGLVGFNATIPHKQNIIPLLDEVTSNATMIGAVNTVWRTEKGWKGTNTDIDGFIAPLKKLNRDWSQITPVILGNGGAARAVVVGCAELECPTIHVVGRNQDKLDHFYQSWANTSLQSSIKVHSWNDLQGLILASELLINTTPVGMYPHINNSPVDEEIIKKIRPNAIAYDLIYTPRPTLFLQQAQAQGAIIIDGTEMLVQQGAKGFEIWTSKSAPVDVMRQALLNLDFV